MADFLEFVKTAAKVKAATTGAASGGALAGLMSGLTLAAAIPSQVPTDLTGEDALSLLSRALLVYIGLDPTLAALLVLVAPTVVGGALPALLAFRKGWATAEPAENVRAVP